MLRCNFRKFLLKCEVEILAFSILSCMTERGGRGSRRDHIHPPLIYVVRASAPFATQAESGMAHRDSGGLLLRLLQMPQSGILVLVEAIGSLAAIEILRGREKVKC
jgi:hypothetical protein